MRGRGASVEVYADPAALWTALWSTPGRIDAALFLDSTDASAEWNKYGILGRLWSVWGVFNAFWY